MLISKFDLYKREWLELVFDDRNKAYGAYELRQHYSRTMVTAMAIAFLTVGSAAFIIGAVIKPVVAAIPIFHVTPISIIRVIHPPVVHPPSHSAHRTTATHIPIHSAPVFMPTTAPVAVQPVKPTIAPPDPGIVSVDNTPGTPGVSHPGGQPGSGTEGIDVPGNGAVVSDFTSLERMPQPVGGPPAWSKFLMKHINYPAMASDAHAQGAVWVSFIIEADGKLSNIKVLRGPGYGMDEEAVRVLKMAPAWIPGMQNGHTVRVFYTVPIRFTINDDNE